MASVIVGVHGFANKPRKEVLEGWWKKSIDEGLKINCRIVDAKYRFVMVYWADLLYEHCLHDDKEREFDHLYNREPYRPAAEGMLKAYRETWRDNLQATILGGRKTESHVREMAADWVQEKVLKGIASYYDPKNQFRYRAGGRHEMRQVLMDELKNELLPLRGDNIMLIAHAMGSIVAYEVLRDIGHKDRSFEVAEFVTIGSPLGLSHVKMTIFEKHERRSDRTLVRTPTVVTKHWKNYADPKDPVALDTHLRDDYEANKAGVRVQDDLVSNDYVNVDGSHNYHKSYGYIRTPEFSKHVAKFLKELEN